jgi:hypothetical protein
LLLSSASQIVAAVTAIGGQLNTLFGTIVTDLGG